MQHHTSQIARSDMMDIDQPAARHEARLSGRQGLTRWLDSAAVECRSFFGTNAPDPRDMILGSRFGASRLPARGRD